MGDPKFRPRGHGPLIAPKSVIAVGEAFTCPNAQRHKDLIEKLLDLIAVDCAIDRGKIRGELYGNTVVQTVKDIADQVDKVHHALQPHLARIKAESKVHAT